MVQANRNKIITCGSLIALIILSSFLFDKYEKKKADQRKTAAIEREQFYKNNLAEVLTSPHGYRFNLYSSSGDEDSKPDIIISLDIQVLKNGLWRDVIVSESMEKEYFLDWADSFWFSLGENSDEIIDPKSCIQQNYAITTALETAKEEVARLTSMQNPTKIELRYLAALKEAMSNDMTTTVKNENGERGFHHIPIKVPLSQAIMPR